MGEEGNSRGDGQSGERIIVAVKDVGEENQGQATLTSDHVRAKRIVESLVERGVEPEAVSALEAREVPFKVSYRWVVELVEKGSRAGGPRMVSRLLEDVNKLLRTIAPERPFELRLDRVVWVGLWAASLLVLGISLVTSLSRGAAREVVIEIPAQFEGSSESQAPFESPSASPLNQNTGAEGRSPLAAGASRVPECATGGTDDCQCGNFGTQPEAQAFYEIHPPGPGHIVDPDGNGVVCEWLPRG